MSFKLYDKIVTLRAYDYMRTDVFERPEHILLRLGACGTIISLDNHLDEPSFYVNMENGKKLSFFAHEIQLETPFFWTIRTDLLVAQTREIITSEETGYTGNINGSLRRLMGAVGRADIPALRAGDRYGFYWAEFLDSEGIALRLEVHLELLWREEDAMD